MCDNSTCTSSYEINLNTQIYKNRKNLLNYKYSVWYDINNT